MAESNAAQTDASEFPPDLLPLLRCNRDAGPLVIAAGLRRGTAGIIEARLQCSTCAAEYRVEDGIARMLPGTLTGEDEHEIALRDVEEFCSRPGPFVPPAHGWRSEYSDLLEIPPHLSELEPHACRVLELGCGDGRFTMLMAQMGARVLAVDFSINALRKLAWRLPTGLAPTAYQLAPRRPTADLRGRVGLVQAHAGHLHVAPRSFDRAFSTTPLDSREERMAMYRTIADALTDDGRFVGSVEHDDLARRLLGLPKARRYSEGGIFIEHFDIATMQREAAPYFSKLRFRLIRPRFPFVAKLPRTWAVRFARMLTAMPVLRHLGEIQVLRAERPVRPPVEGVYRHGNKLAKAFFRWYMRRMGSEPLWDGAERI